MYSSVGAEERRRAISIEEERKNLDYQAFNANGGDVTNVDVTAEVGDTLGATQPMTTTLAAINTDIDNPNEVIDGKLLKDRDNKGKSGGKNNYQKIVNDTTQQDERANPYDENDNDDVDGPGGLKFDN